MKPKELYIVSSLHYTDDKEKNIRYSVHEIQEVRLKVMEAIARTIGNGGYFQDGSTEGHCHLLNGVLKNMSSEEIQENRELMSGGKLEELEGEDFFMYEISKIVELFKKLQEEGFHFEYKPTEDCTKEEMVDFFMDEIIKDPDIRALCKVIGITNPEAIDNADELRTLLKGKHKELGEELERLIDNRILQSRDKRTVKNVEKHGEEKNILFIGIGHVLEALDKSLLIKAYRLFVQGIMGEILVSGIVPEEFQKELEKLPKRTKSGKKIDTKDIEYIDVPWNYIPERDDA